MSYDDDLDRLERALASLNERLGLALELIFEVDVLMWENEFEDWRYA